MTHDEKELLERDLFGMTTDEIEEQAARCGAIETLAEYLGDARGELLSGRTDKAHQLLRRANYLAGLDMRTLLEKSLSIGNKDAARTLEALDEFEALLRRANYVAGLDMRTLLEKSLSIGNEDAARLLEALDEVKAQDPTARCKHCGWKGSKEGLEYVEAIIRGDQGTGEFAAICPECGHYTEEL